MSDLDEIRERLGTLEEAVDRLRADAAARREDVTATRTLAALADRDAAEVRGALRGHTQVLNALRESQIEHGQVLGALVAGQHRHDEVLDRHSEVLDRHGVMLDGLTTAVAAIAEGQERQTEGLNELTAMVRRLVQGQPE